VFLEIEEFISWILSLEPDKTQLHFCLGLINYFGLEEYKHARTDFEKFLNHAENGKYGLQKRSAEKYLSVINTKLMKK
jgi:hypothetical protein